MREVGVSFTYVKVKDLNVGDVIKGVYLRSFTSGDYDKLSHQILKDDGETIALNGTGQLDWKMSSVAVNSPVIITYKGRETVRSGPRKGTEAHGWKVEADKFNNDNNETESSTKQDPFEFPFGEKAGTKS